ncbi:hypothetical protein BDV95DRAFT_594064 [Massariosphaeria phaeospora]|uniref:Uncharacterized protein n=1 Tax=Massariosphaeria phaeospora TaxID=100035 RepID=A0A7C8ICJ9_9PLEO|nr:hypothetical protein BDV95DRAFT_594064 [Massariosphaeria phaeospora]
MNPLVNYIRSGEAFSEERLDPGFSTTRAGFAGEDVPNSVCPSFYGQIDSDAGPQYLRTPSWGRTRVRRTGGYGGGHCQKTAPSISPVSQQRRNSAFRNPPRPDLDHAIEEIDGTDLSANGPHLSLTRRFSEHVSGWLVGRYARHAQIAANHYDQGALEIDLPCYYAAPQVPVRTGRTLNSPEEILKGYRHHGVLHWLWSGLACDQCDENVVSSMRSINTLARLEGDGPLHTPSMAVCAIAAHPLSMGPASPPTGESEPPQPSGSRGDCPDCDKEFPGPSQPSGGHGDCPDCEKEFPNGGLSVKITLQGLPRRKAAEGRMAARRTIHSINMIRAAWPGLGRFFQKESGVLVLSSNLCLDAGQVEAPHGSQMIIETEGAPATPPVEAQEAEAIPLAPTSIGIEVQASGPA